MTNNNYIVCNIIYSYMKLYERKDYLKLEKKKFDEKVDAYLKDMSIYKTIDEHIDELTKKITAQFGFVVHWNGTMDLPQPGETKLILRYGDAIIQNGKVLDPSTYDDFDYFESSGIFHETNKELVISILSTNETALEMFCKDYNVDFLKASYTLECPGPKSIAALDKFYEENLDEIMSDRQNTL